MLNSQTLTVAHVNLSKSNGAAERQTILLIKYLAALGVKQALVCRDTSQIAMTLRKIPNLSFVRISGSDVLMQGHIKLGKRFAVVHAHDVTGAKWSFLHYLMFATPYVISTRDQEIENDGILTKAIFLWAKAVVASTDGAAYKIHKDFELEKVRVIPSCISELNTQWQNVENIRASLSNRFIVGQVAPLINRKYCQTLLIDAARILQQKIPAIVVLFIGEGDNKVLVEYAREMSNVRFVDPKFQVLGDYIKAMDVFVCPVNGGGSMTIQTVLDALDLNVPVVTTDFPGIKTYVEDGRSALVVPRGDAQALADAILRIRDDVGLRNMLKENGKLEAQKLAPEIMSMQYYDLYRALLA